MAEAMAILENTIPPVREMTSAGASADWPKHSPWRTEQEAYRYHTSVLGHYCEHNPLRIPCRVGDRVIFDISDLDNQTTWVRHEKWLRTIVVAKFDAETGIHSLESTKYYYRYYRKQIEGTPTSDSVFPRIVSQTSDYDAHVSQEWKITRGRVVEFENNPLWDGSYYDHSSTAGEMALGKVRPYHTSETPSAGECTRDVLGASPTLIKQRPDHVRFLKERSDKTQEPLELLWEALTWHCRRKQIGTPYATTPKFWSTDDDSKCGICLDEMRTKEPAHRCPGCKKYVHTYCGETHILSEIDQFDRKTCPYCRAQINWRRPNPKWDPNKFLWRLPPDQRRVASSASMIGMHPDGPDYEYWDPPPASPEPEDWENPHEGEDVNYSFASQSLETNDEKEDSSAIIESADYETTDATIKDTNTRTSVEEMTAKENPDGTNGLHCDTCGAYFQNLDQFMDHRNYDCLSGEGVNQRPDTNFELQNEDPSSPCSECSEEFQKSPEGDTSSSNSPPIDTGSQDDFPFVYGTSEAHPYSCTFCNKSFTRLNHLKIHEQVHGDQLPFDCKFCNKRFRHKRSRDRHVKLHTGDKRFKCSHCDAAFASGSKHAKCSNRSCQTTLRCKNTCAVPECMSSSFPPRRLYHNTGCDIDEFAISTHGCDIDEIYQTVYIINRSDHLKSHMRTHDNSKPFQCSVCNRGYTSTAALVSHMLIHKTDGDEQNQMLKCYHCQEVFELACDLEEHMDCCHNGGSFICSICNVELASMEEMNIHMSSEHDIVTRADQGMNSDKSEIIASRLASTDKYREQKANNDNTRNMLIKKENTTPGLDVNGNSSFFSADILVCPYCFHDNFNSIEMLELHMQSVHSVKPTEIYTCNYCNAPYPNLYALHEHMRAVHSIQPTMDIKYPCSSCNREFSSINALYQHKKAAHAKDLSPHDAQGAQTIPNTVKSSGNERSSRDRMASVDKIKKENTKTSQSYTRVSSDTASKPLKAEQQPMTLPVSTYSRSPVQNMRCDHCNAVFNDANNFQAHMKIHLESVSLKHKCKQCNEHFPSEEMLENHSSSHFLNLSTEYGCTCCMKLFSKPDELQKHLMDIHAHHLYRCSLCKEIFDSKVNIQVHFAIKHSNECKLYKCTECDTVFRSEMEWQVHVKITHLMISKPFRCLFCSESFLTEIELQCHLTTHNKSFKCSMCDESFHVEYLLDKHLQSVHSETDSTNIVVPKIELTSSPGKNVAVEPKEERPESNSSVSAPSSGIWKNVDTLHICNICDAKFSHPTLLQAHKIQDHKIPVSVSIQSHDRNIEMTPLLSNASNTYSFACSFCSQNFKNKCDLDKHARIHLNVGNLKCSICDEVFSSSNLLAEHKLSHCKIQQGNLCFVCKVALKGEEQYYMHSMEHGYQGTVMQCIICRQTLDSTVELQLHGKHHFQPSALYTCCVCLKTFDCKENLISKLNTSGRAYYVCKPCYHGELTEYPCPECSEKFSNSAQLEVHTATHKKSYQCIKCQESFRSEYEIQIHVATHMITEGSNNECKLCNRNFESPSKLQCHLIEHTYENSEMICSFCCRVFTNTTDIQSHAIEHGPSARKYCCSCCPQKFFFSAELRNHAFAHENATSPPHSKGSNSSFTKTDKVESVPTTKAKDSKLFTKLKFSATPTLYQCPDCNKTFHNIANLNSHRKTHQIKEAFNLIRCSSCPQTFNDIKALQAHFFAKHTSKDPNEACEYKCKECKLTFPDRSRFDMHMRRHGSGKECSKPHIKMSSANEQYVCPICGKSFFSSGNVREHMKSIHAEDITNVNGQNGLSDMESNNDDVSMTSDDAPTTQQLSGVDELQHMDTNDEISNSDHMDMPSKPRFTDMIIKTEIDG